MNTSSKIAIIAVAAVAAAVAIGLGISGQEEVNGQAGAQVEGQAGSADIVAAAEQDTGSGTLEGPADRKTISVVGAASASVEPDLLVLRLGVESRGETVRDTLDSNSGLVESVVGAVTDAGISEDEISTSRFNIRPVYNSYESDGEWEQRFAGYRVTNTIMVETGNLDATAAIIDGAVDAGANRVDSVFFALSAERRQEITESLVGEAIDDARAKAANALGPLNHEVIGIDSVYLSGFGPGQDVFRSASFAMADHDSAYSSTPIFESDQKITTSVGIIFLIAESES